MKEKVSDNTEDLSRSEIASALFLFVGISTLPAIKIFSTNFNRIPIIDFLYLLIFLIVFSIILYKILLSYLPGAGHKPLLLTVVMLCLLSGNYILYPLAKHPFIWVTLCSAIGIAVYRSEKIANIIGFALSVIIVIHIAGSSAKIINSHIWPQREATRQQLHEAQSPFSLEKLATEKSSERDIYYLIFDRYARKDQLKEKFGFDNSEFLSALEARGFRIFDRASSNYQRTAHSLASSLNLDYLSAGESQSETINYDWVPLYELLDDFLAARLFRELGYQINTLGSWWEPTRLNVGADENFTWRAWPAMPRLLFENSLFGTIFRNQGVALFDSRLLQCQRPARKFSKIKRISEDSSLSFVFAHFLVPHPPYVLDHTGRCLSIKEANERSRQENYVGQLQYANQQILSMIDHILAQPGPTPIILVQSDEGPWPAEIAGDEVTRLGSDTTLVKWKAADGELLREKMGILSAMLLPDVDSSPLPDDASPVNTFRFILDTYFDADIPLLPNRHFVYESEGHIYSFKEVTQLLVDE